MYESRIFPDSGGLKGRWSSGFGIRVVLYIAILCCCYLVGPMLRMARGIPSSLTWSMNLEHDNNKIMPTHKKIQLWTHTKEKYIMLLLSLFRHSIFTKSLGQSCGSALLRCCATSSYRCLSPLSGWWRPNGHCNHPTRTGRGIKTGGWPLRGIKATRVALIATRAADPPARWSAITALHRMVSARSEENQR
jgi:hypothetical protein